MDMSCSSTLVMACSMNRSGLYVSIKTLTYGFDMIFRIPPTIPWQDGTDTMTRPEENVTCFPPELQAHGAAAGPGGGATAASGPAVRTRPRCAGASPCVWLQPPNDDSSDAGLSG